MFKDGVGIYWIVFIVDDSFLVFWGDFVYFLDIGWCKCIVLFIIEFCFWWVYFVFWFFKCIWCVGRVFYVWGSIVVVSVYIGKWGIIIVFFVWFYDVIFIRWGIFISEILIFIYNDWINYVYIVRGKFVFIWFCVFVSCWKYYEIFVCIRKIRRIIIWIMWIFKIVIKFMG